MSHDRLKMPSRIVNFMEVICLVLLFAVQHLSSVHSVTKQMRVRFPKTSHAQQAHHTAGDAETRKIHFNPTFSVICPPMIGPTEDPIKMASVLALLATILLCLWNTSMRIAVLMLMAEPPNPAAGIIKRCTRHSRKRGHSPKKRNKISVPTEGAYAQAMLKATRSAAPA